MNWDDAHRSNYESKAFSPENWVTAARALVASAKAVEPKVIEYWESYRENAKDNTKKLLADNYQGPYFMLYAFAIENYFKSAIVQSNTWELKDNFKNNPVFPKELRSHQLVLLAQKADLDISIVEEDLLRRLTRHAIWAGRYPVPTKYKEISSAERFNDGQEYLVTWFGGDDVEKLSVFVGSLEKRLKLPRM